MTKITAEQRNTTRAQARRRREALAAINATTRRLARAHARRSNAAAWDWTGSDWP